MKLNATYPLSRPGASVESAFSRLLEETAQLVGDGVRSAGTLAFQRDHAAWWCRRLGPRFPLDEITADLLDAIARDRTSLRPGRALSPRTTLKRLCTLRSALKAAYRRGVLATLPVFPLVLAPFRRRRRIFESFADYRRLVAALPVHRAEWIALCFWTLQRSSDVERAAWADVNLDADPPTIVIRSTKTRREPIRVRCPRELADVLRARRRRLEDEGIPPRPEDPLVERWGDRAHQLPLAAVKVGLPPMNSVDLRHSGISVMIRRTGITRAAQEWGGWSDFATMSRYYAHALPVQLGQCATELDSWKDEKDPSDEGTANDNNARRGRSKTRAPKKGPGHTG